MDASPSGTDTAAAETAGLASKAGKGLGMIIGMVAVCCVSGAISIWAYFAGKRKSAAESEKKPVEKQPGEGEAPVREAA